MKKKSPIAVIMMISILLLCICAALFFFRSRSPFKDLTAADIASAQVHLIPPDKTVEVKETGRLAEHLNALSTYNKTNLSSDLTGQTITITLNLKDGTKMEINEAYPFLTIDGTTYREKYTPAEALNRYANSLLD